MDSKWAPTPLLNQSDSLLAPDPLDRLQMDP